jgi:hypothetical protein
MPQTISAQQPLGNSDNLKQFAGDIITLLSIVEQCGPVLFRKEFRQKLSKAIKEAQEELENEVLPRLENKEYEDKLKAAGLTDNQLLVKLESYNYAASTFDQEGTQENLVGLLDIASILLGSLLDALGVGSLVRELADLMLKEMKIRLPRLPFKWRKKTDEKFKGDEGF